MLAPAPGALAFAKTSVFFLAVIMVSSMHVQPAAAAETAIWVNDSKCEGEPAYTKAADAYCVTDFALGDWGAWEASTGDKVKITGFEDKCTSGNQALGISKAVAWNECGLAREVGADKFYFKGAGSTLSPALALIITAAMIVLARRA
jgi:hypothetical protein